MSEERFLRMKDLVEKTSLSRTTIHRMVAAGTFPKQERLTHRVAVWRASEIEAWMRRADVVSDE